MATGGSDMANQITECSVCLESMLYKDPRLLTCGHTFCTPCIKQLAAINPTTCPECRTETLLPTEVEMLPRNIKFITMCHLFEKVLLNIKDNEHDKLCDICLKKNEKIKATHICTQCPQKLICQLCVDKHSMFPPLKSHNIVLIETEPNKNLTTEICLTHKEPIEYFCVVCQFGICVQCMYEDGHKGHEHHITDFEPGVRLCGEEININGEIKKKLSNLYELQDELETNLKLVRDYLEILTKVKGHLRPTVNFMIQIEKVSGHLTEAWSQIETLDDYDFLDKVKGLIEESEEIIHKMKTQSNTHTSVTYIPGKVPSTLMLERQKLFVVGKCQSPDDGAPPKQTRINSYDKPMR